MAIVIGLIPAVLWGVMPLLVSKIGGRPQNQIYGTAIGAFALGLVVFLVRRPDIGGEVFWYCFLSGASWAFGQMLQYTAYTEIGVSRAMPISTSFQLLGTSLLGVLALGEWATVRAKLVGFGAIALIIAGAALSTWHQNKAAGQDAEHKENMVKGVLTLMVSTIGYVGYSGFPRFVSADGWVEFFPQMVGMLTMGVAFAAFSNRGIAFKEKTSYLNILPGLVFAGGALAYLISTTMNGVAVGFALSQMNVVIATWGSILFLGEEKTHREKVAVFLGLGLVVAGGVIISFAG